MRTHNTCGILEKRETRVSTVGTRAGQKWTHAILAIAAFSVATAMANPARAEEATQPAAQKSADAQGAAPRPAPSEAERWVAPPVSFSLINAELNGIAARKAANPQPARKARPSSEATAASHESPEASIGAALGVVPRSEDNSVAAMLASSTETARGPQNRNTELSEKTQSPSSAQSASSALRDFSTTTNLLASDKRNARMDLSSPRVAATAHPDQDSASTGAGDGAAGGGGFAGSFDASSPYTSTVGTSISAWTAAPQPVGDNNGGFIVNRDSVVLQADTPPQSSPRFFSNSADISDNGPVGSGSSSSLARSTPSPIGKDILGESSAAAGGTLGRELVAFWASHSITGTSAKPAISKSKARPPRHSKAGKNTGPRMHRNMVESDVPSGAALDTPISNFVTHPIQLESSSANGTAAPATIGATDAVPEPGCLSIFALGVGGLLARRPRRRSRI